MVNVDNTHFIFKDGQYDLVIGQVYRSSSSVFHANKSIVTCKWYLYLGRKEIDGVTRSGKCMHTYFFLSDIGMVYNGMYDVNLVRFKPLDELEEEGEDDA